VYDTLLGSGVFCPAGMACSRIGGRLAYVRAKLMCAASSAGDGTIDQETFYAYDDAGRVIREYVRDDTGRIADHVYTWTKSGEPASTTTPSGAVIGSTFGSATSNSDTDRVTAIWRTNTSTPIANAITWYPYGALKQYNQMNSVSNKLQRTAISRNLAYRITNIAVENQSNGTDTFAVSITEDAKGRVTKRDYSLAATGVQDSYFLYDDQDRVMCETTNLVSSCPTSGTNIKNSRTANAFTGAGDWLELLRPVPGSTGGLMNSFNPLGYGGTHRLTMVRQNDGTPQLGDTIFSYDAQGRRISDDNTSTLTNDARTYTYDSRGNVTNVHGQYFTGGVWHDYDVASAFDAKNRRVTKTFRDTSTAVTAQWFFYYDAMDRLNEIRYTPNIDSAATYSVFQLFWLADRIALFWQADYPTVTTSRRYVATDETARPIDMWSWPASGNAARVWAINPAAWGFDTNATGPTVYQPMLLAGQYTDSETIAPQNGGTGLHRPGVALNGFRTYDPFVGAYLQIDPLVDESVISYNYAGSDPVGKADPSGTLDVEVTLSDGSTTVCYRSRTNIEGGISSTHFDKSQIGCVADAEHVDGDLSCFFDPSTCDGPWIPYDNSGLFHCEHLKCRGKWMGSKTTQREMEHAAACETEVVEIPARPNYTSKANACAAGYTSCLQALRDNGSQCQFEAEVADSQGFKNWCETQPYCKPFNPPGSGRP
jgi:RHS repeat-associated protein